MRDASHEESVRYGKRGGKATIRRWKRIAVYKKWTAKAEQGKRRSRERKGTREQG